ncbi:MAG: DUF1330 domain-containing protein [Spirochaetales bacterium]|nr:DUF1330 domain-containing protein [Spirochaetales bacterium]
MAVYIIIEYVKIDDESIYSEYIKKAEPIVKKYKGKYIVRTNKIKSLSEHRKPERLVIIKFPSQDDLNKCFGSEEYRSLSSLRTKSTESKAIIVEEYIE